MVSTLVVISVQFKRVKAYIWSDCYQCVYWQIYAMSYSSTFKTEKS